MLTLRVETATGEPTASEQIRVARTEREVEELRPAWEALGVSYVDASLDYFLALVRSRKEVVRPHVVLLERDGLPHALVVGRIEETRLPCQFGYRTVVRPRVTALRISHGGVSGDLDEATAEALVRELDRTLAAGDADVVIVPAVRVDSPLADALLRVPGTLRRQRFAQPYTHRRLVLPPSFEALLASRDRRSRYNLKRQTSMLEREFGDDLAVEMLAAPADFERIFDALETVAAKTYQRGLGAGFIDTDERRAQVRIALDRGWFRAWVLRVRGTPVAFWQGNRQGRTFFVSSTGFDPAYSRHNVGTYLQLKMFEDLCADPEIDVVDFGWGDADYKSRFGNESWLEHDLMAFAPTLRGIRLSLVRASVCALDLAARRAANRIGATSKIKRLWRRRLRSQHQQD